MPSPIRPETMAPSTISTGIGSGKNLWKNTDV